jgi:DNA-binding NtrC family response regulator
MSVNILIIDDEPKMAGILKRVLTRDSYNVDITHDPEEGVSMMRKNKYDVILSDLKMPGMNGIEVLKNANVLQKEADFIMMTAYATVETAIEAMKLGAFDYLIKPFPIEDLKLLLKRVIETKSIKEESPPVIKQEKLNIDNIIAESNSMQKILRRAFKVAKSNASVLIRGESGVGKEVIARAIHLNSPRKDNPLITVNCGAIPENLLESELFGHVKGSFTGAVDSREGLFKAADKGSIFLDEIGEIPTQLQVKLLRVLQEGEFMRVGESRLTTVDVRVIAATNLDLEEAIKNGRFRKDLYYRLNVIPVHIDPLRDRRDDILPLVNHFLKKHEIYGESLEVDPQVFELLKNYSWPGNVRELENAVEHAAVLCEDERIRVEDLPAAIQSEKSGFQDSGDMSSSIDHLTLEELERRSISAALKKTGGNQTRAADFLGITRRTLGYRIKKYELDKEMLLED